MTKPDAQDLQRRLTELGGKHGVVGASLAVMSDGDITEVVHGTANLRTGLAVTPETTFQIGSMSKVYTATLVMQLVDEGLIDLDKPVREYLTDFRNADEVATSTITTRQLLCHTSGMDGDVFEEFGRGDDCVEKYVAAMSTLAQTSEPGEFFSYCNSGYILLGRIIEHFRGCSWDDALRKYLVEPLGVENTVTLPEEAILRSSAVGHLALGENGAPQVAPMWFMSRAVGPAGVISATPRDVLAFVRMHLRDGTADDGTRVLSEASAQAMRELQVEQIDPHTLGEGWALGWILYKLAGPTVYGHDGATIGQQAYLRVIPEKNFAVVLLTNGGAAGSLFTDLVRPLLKEYADTELVSPAFPPDPLPDVDVTPFLGVYERAGQRIEVKREDSGELFLEMKATGPLAGVMPDEPPTPLVPYDSTRLITKEADKRIGVHMVLQFIGEGPNGFRHIHLGGRATPRAGG